MKKIWTICILTINDRDNFYKRLRSILDDQVIDQPIEILTIKDNREKSIGEKRQIALDNCKTKYVSFIDDDDVVSTSYCELILEQLEKDVDGVGFRGIVNGPNSHPIEFVHKNGFDYTDIPVKYFGSYVYLRPLNHLNPIKLEYAKQIGYQSINVGEDKDFSIRLKENNLIKDEILINEYLYFYQYRGKNKI